MGRRICAVLVAVVAWVATGAFAPARAGADPVVITYEVRGRGNLSALEDLAATAASVYAAPRGWSLGGGIRFERVEAGGAFSLWLASDALVSTFGGACDRVWSCRNGRNVVINEDRWLGATDSWRVVGAPLETYREMVLNHETGHWLGFGHASCAGPGAAAPVMQQQSMTLAGCAPNPWPLPSERTALAARCGVTIMPAGKPVEPSTTSTTTSTSTSTTTTTPTSIATTSTARSSTTFTTVAPPPMALSRQEKACLRQVPPVALRFWRRCF